MPHYRIRPLMVSVIQSSKGVATYMVDSSMMAVSPVFAFYIEGGGKKVLVDTGLSSPGLVRGAQGYVVKDYGRQGVIDALAGIGLKSEDIDVVVITHMHIDHGGNIGLFPHAEFIMQQREWNYASNPLPVHRGVYLTELLPELAGYNLRLIDGDYDIMEGVKVVCVPGHTDGQSAVVVETSAGPYVIAGDLISIKHNIYPELNTATDAYGNETACTPLIGHEIYPVGIHTSLIDWYDSVERLLAIAGSREHILPGHDTALIGKVFPEE